MQYQAQRHIHTADNGTGVTGNTWSMHCQTKCSQLQFMTSSMAVCNGEDSKTSSCGSTAGLSECSWQCTSRRVTHKYLSVVDSAFHCTGSKPVILLLCAALQQQFGCSDSHSHSQPHAARHSLLLQLVQAAAVAHHTTNRKNKSRGARITSLTSP